MTLLKTCFILFFVCLDLVASSQKRPPIKEDNGLAGKTPDNFADTGQLDVGKDKLPRITNYYVHYDHSSQSLKLTYDVADSEENHVALHAYYFSDRGNFLLPFSSSGKGDEGNSVSVGPGKTIEIPFSDKGEKKSVKVALVVEDKINLPVVGYMQQVDTGLLRRDVESIYGIRNHVSAPDHLRAVQQILQDSLSRYGYDIIVQRFAYPNYEGKNIIARKNGYGKGRKKLIVCAHYDSVEDSPGADDNGSGVAALLELARILAALPVENTVELIAFDLEEYGMVGSKKYVELLDSSNESLLGAINLDMIGYMSTKENSQIIPEPIGVAFPLAKKQVEENDSKGDFIICIANSSSSGLRDRFADLMSRDLPSGKLISLVTPGKGEEVPIVRYSDHSSFWDKGYPAIFIEDGANSRNPNYHSPEDKTGTLNYAFMKDVTEAVLDLVIEYCHVGHGRIVWKSVKL